MATDNIGEMLPNRADSDIPLQVRYILSLCEVALGWYDYQERHMDEPQECFCRGLFDYWWSDDLNEPHWEQIFQKDLHEQRLKGFPEHERFCYQQGAILGYKLREEYKDEDISY